MQTRTRTTAFASAATGLVAGALLTVVANASSAPATPETLSFSGVIRQNGQPAAGARQVTFSFKKSGSSVCAPEVSVTADAAGTFTAQIPLTNCPADLFEGGTVTVDVSTDGKVVASDQAVSPVPQAKYADVAGQLAGYRNMCKLYDTATNTDLGYWVGNTRTYDPVSNVVITRSQLETIYYTSSNCTGTPYIFASDQGAPKFANVRYVGPSGTRLRIASGATPQNVSISSYKTARAACKNNSSSIQHEGVYALTDEGVPATDYDPTRLELRCE